MRSTVRLHIQAFLAGVAIALGLTSSDARAQARGNVAVTCQDCETGRSITPTFTIIASNFSSARPLRFRLEVDTSARFIAPIEFDTTFTRTDSVVTVAPVRALPEQQRFFYRATVSDPNGVTGASSVVGPFMTPQWLTLLAPQLISGRPLRTLRPKFVWRSPDVNAPPGPWRYVVRITGAGQFLEGQPGSDTTFIPTALEANARYSLSFDVLLNGQSQAVGPFIFTTEDTARAVTSTTLYQNFPNPFPISVNGAPLTDVTCIWFDLRDPSPVTLEVFTIRGVPVRRLVPNDQLQGVLAAGRYGRGRAGTSESCDPRVQWDGRDNHGRSVPEGVYLIRFKGDGIEATKKVVFRGR